MRAAKRRLANTGNLDMYFVYVLPEDDPVREVPDQVIVNSSEAKTIQFKYVAARAREMGAAASHVRQRRLGAR